MSLDRATRAYARPSAVLARRARLVVASTALVSMTLCGALIRVGAVSTASASPVSGGRGRSGVVADRSFDLVRSPVSAPSPATPAAAASVGPPSLAELPIPGNPIGFDGILSWFGGPNDHSSGPRTYDGGSVSLPGVAIRQPGTNWKDPNNVATLGGYWLVSLPNGRHVVLKQRDLGPHEWTKRNVDLSFTALESAGYTEKSFPTGQSASVKYLGKSEDLARFAARPLG